MLLQESREVQNGLRGRYPQFKYLLVGHFCLVIGPTALEEVEVERPGTDVVNQGATFALSTARFGTCILHDG